MLAYGAKWSVGDQLHPNGTLEESTYEIIGESGLWKDRAEFAFDLRAEYEGLSPYYPPDNEPNRGHDFMLPVPKLRAPFVNMPQVMYERSRRIRVTKVESLGQIFDPYFNRNWDHFCSHQHTPNQDQPSRCDCGVRHGNILYFAHPVFRHYRAYGAVAYREFIQTRQASLARASESNTRSGLVPSTTNLNSQPETYFSPL